jgi:CRP-like cAMP-binding protein
MHMVLNSLIFSPYSNGQSCTITTTILCPETRNRNLSFSLFQAEYVDFLESQSLSAESGLMDKYCLAVYFTNTMFTTVGFGDVSATNTLERWFSGLIMYVGCIFFGILLSEVQSIIAQYNQLELKRGRLVHGIKEFLRSNNTPADLERKIIRWVSFDFEVKQRKETEDIALSHVPPDLRRSLIAHLHKDLLFRVPFLRALRSLRREDLLVDLFACMEPMTFCKGLPVATRTSKADKLLAISHGYLNMVLYDVGVIKNVEGITISTLNPGDMIGQGSLLGDETYRYFDILLSQNHTSPRTPRPMCKPYTRRPRASPLMQRMHRTSHGLPCEFYALSFVTCLALTRRDFDVILSCYDIGIQQEIKAAKVCEKESRHA